jgi:hypothetical protein
MLSVEVKTTLTSELLRNENDVEKTVVEPLPL